MIQRCRETLSLCLGKLSSCIKDVARRIKTGRVSEKLSLPLQQPAQQPQSSAKVGQHLLLCIDKGEHWTGLHQERLDHVENDYDVFQLLQQQYFRRKDWASWITMRCVKRLSLARVQAPCSRQYRPLLTRFQFKADPNDFAAVHRHEQVCVSKCICLPPVERVEAEEYLCRPAPKVELAYYPAIGPNELTHYFMKPHAFHTAQRSILNQLPKRASGPLTVLPDDAQLGWGLHFEQGWHWKTIYLLVSFPLILGSLVFAIVWSIARGTIQDAFAMASLWMSLGPVFLGYLALRDIS